MNSPDIRYLLKDKYHLTEHTISELVSDLSKLQEGYPLAYLIGYVDFLESKIDLSYKPLIPRPETEYWVDLAIKSISTKTDKPNILDIFSGSGCIGISLLKHIPNSHVTLTDVHPDFIVQIKHNLSNQLFSDRSTVIQSDLFENLQNQKFDYIFANPPYVDKNEKHEDSLKYENGIGLFAAENGLAVIKQFLKEAYVHLNQSGQIYMEFGENQKDLIEKLLELKHYAKVEFFKDQYDKWRYLRAIL